MNNLRLVLSLALPSVTALIGFLYFFGRKRAKGKDRKAIKGTETQENHSEIEEKRIAEKENLSPTVNHKITETEQTCRSRRRERDKEIQPNLPSPEPVQEINFIKDESIRTCQSLPHEAVAEMDSNQSTSATEKPDELSSVPLNWADSVVEESVVEVLDSLNQPLLKDDASMSPLTSRPAEDVPQAGTTPSDVNCSSQPEFLSTKSVRILPRPSDSQAIVNTSEQSVSSSTKSLAKPSESSQGGVGANISNRDISTSAVTHGDNVAASKADDESVSTPDPQISASKSLLVESSSGCDDVKQSISENSTSTLDSSSASVVIEVSSDTCHSDVTSQEKTDFKDSSEQNSSSMACGDGSKQGSSSSSAASDNTLLTNSKSKMADSSVAADAVQCPDRLADHNGSAAVAGSSESPGCDSNSEASNDSGRGGSVTEPLPLPMMVSDTVRYEFNFPSELCGRLIGKNGRNINLVKEKSGANIALKNNPCTPNFQICVIEGSQPEIDEALVQIRRKFPRSQFPQVDLTPLSQVVQEAPVLMPDIMQLNLPEGVSVDIVVSNIVDAGHIFVQQPTHPTFSSLERLNHFMNACYTQDHMVPPLPRPIEVGVICAAFMVDGWFRAQVVNVCENSDEVDIKYVDYGGYARLQASLLKQIRSDFMTLPFQAVECYMGNITPLQEEEYFSDEASTVLEELTQGKLLQAQVVNRAEDCIPYLHIYQISGNRVLFINREMVNRKVVRWIEILQ